MRVNGAKINSAWIKSSQVSREHLAKATAHVSNSIEGNELNILSSRIECRSIAHRSPFRMISDFYEMRINRMDCIREIDTLRLSIHTTKCVRWHNVDHKSREIHFVHRLWCHAVTLATITRANPTPTLPWNAFQSCGVVTDTPPAYKQVPSNASQFNENATDTLTFNFMNFPWNFMLFAWNWYWPQLNSLSRNFCTAHEFQAKL